ncbi:flagellar protein FlaG [Paenibacillus thermotolerans]|uniref:flagellar protein FlaG n=1 Tax=Paenibacillus thermotolerans TaxID=3027807 RepID=UPI0023687B84|nr:MULTISPECIES: flagellar protein FlaG [unclassified Paenibacillus]
MSGISIGGVDRSYPERNPVADVQKTEPVQSGQRHITTSKELKQAAVQGEPLSIAEEQLVKVIEKANKALSGTYTTFEFSIHDKTKEIMVKVLDKETGKVIREIPNEKILDMVAKLWELAGIFIDEKR